MIKERTILHCDLNNFFASVECLDKPQLQNRPVAVCGDPEKRHGIVLAKNEFAKKFNIRTGESLKNALVKCPELIFLPAHHSLYMHYSEEMRKIYRKFTDKIEGFGIDECWLDVTESSLLFGDGLSIAEELRARSKKELGLSISVGISFNKIFAKMGSDYKKPDASTVISQENFKKLLWPLPIENMMYVGKSLAEKFHLFGIHNIGQLASLPPGFLKQYFGKSGMHLHALANGIDSSPVTTDNYSLPTKSIGNSVTCPHDLTSDEEVRAVLFMLCDSVATRLRQHGMKCRSITLSLRNKEFIDRSRCINLVKETNITTILFKAAFELYLKSKNNNEALRALGVCAEKLTPEASLQISLFDDSYNDACRAQLENTVDKLRAKFGKSIIGSGLYLTHPELTESRLLPESSPFGNSVRN